MTILSTSLVTTTNHYTKIMVVCVWVKDGPGGLGKSFDPALLSIRSYNVGLYVCAGHGTGH